MKTIIAGSRGITDMNLVNRAIQASGLAGAITQVVSGTAEGVDRLGEQWGYRHDLPIARFPAAWKTHGKAAGPMRNAEMAAYADALIAVWDGRSSGTRHMIKVARERGLKVYVHEVNAMARINTLDRTAPALPIEDLPMFGGALADQAYPSPFDEPAPTRPIRRIPITCAVCEAATTMPLLADGRLCDVCRLDLPLCRSNIAARDAQAQEAWEDAAARLNLAIDHTDMEDLQRFDAAVEAQRTGRIGGKQYSAAQIQQSWARALEGQDGLSKLLALHDALKESAATLTQVQSWSALARAAVEEAES